MDAAVAGLIGAGIGAAGGIVTATLNFQLQTLKERRGLASAFYGEIEALLQIVERRKYIEGIEYSLMNIQAGAREFYSFKLTRSYFNVYEKNIDKIGLLPSPLPGKIVLLYTIAFAILEDIDTLNGEGINRWENKEIEDHLNELRSLFSEAVSIGEQTQKLIKKKRLLSR
ncbi:hypothetical protein LEP3755_35510 [Leptolyngbya sp. NIES-3755]|nr:hypothetical protein LEP3755_35510 [Leptolyngbya sp. NIES-3755]